LTENAAADNEQRQTDASNHAKLMSFKDVLPVEPGFSKAERVNIRPKGYSPQARTIVRQVSPNCCVLGEKPARLSLMVAALDLPLHRTAVQSANEGLKTVTSKRALISFFTAIALFVSILTPTTFGQRMVFDDWTAVQALTPSDEIVITLKTEQEVKGKFLDAGAAEVSMSGTASGNRSPGTPSRKSI
jgi:hypothetical protein